MRIGQLLTPTHERRHLNWESTSPTWGIRSVKHQVFRFRFHVVVSRGERTGLNPAIAAESSQNHDDHADERAKERKDHRKQGRIPPMATTPSQLPHGALNARSADRRRVGPTRSVVSVRAGPQPDGEFEVHAVLPW
jgi:hypothetical protein